MKKAAQRKLRTQGPPWARSPKGDAPPQPFFAHIGEVERLAAAHAAAMAQYSPIAAAWVADIRAAARLHDCGKLDADNQKVLSLESREKLPVPHEDAGVAWLMEAQRDGAAMLVYSHHSGLPSISEELAKVCQKPPGKMFRRTELIGRSEADLEGFRAHYRAAGIEELAAGGEPKLCGLAARLALSCLVDADHTDSARYRGDDGPVSRSSTRWQERLARLDNYVSSLGQDDSERNVLRGELYQACRTAPLDTALLSCEAVVGSGKTTAVMAYLLRVARTRGLRHIFVIAPFTNIIHQTVKKYREALVLEGEDPHEVVAELHHLADFEANESRGFAALWTAPIIVTTAVQFFETLAACQTARLRKLHELPGSAVFVDEAHASIPLPLWKQTLLWVRDLTENWGCHFVLASGSLTRFWTLKTISNVEVPVRELTPAMVQGRFQSVESARVRLKRCEEPLSLDQLIAFSADTPGPRLVIVNTVHTAAVLARRIERKSDGARVIHLSTALAPIHRKAILERIESRLRDPGDTDWTLVATSCVEAGVDFSFRSAIRESASVASLLQTSGRANRHGEYPGGVDVWTINIADPEAKQHPGFRHSRLVLEELYEEGLLEGWSDRWSPSDLATEALRRESILRDTTNMANTLVETEAACDFRELASKYRVIATDTLSVIVNDSLVQRLNQHQRIASRDLLLNSVQIWGYRLQELAVAPVQSHPELMRWTLGYDEHMLGYMSGVLDSRGGEAHVHIV